MDIKSLTTGISEFRFRFFLNMSGMAGSEPYTTIIRANSEEEAFEKFHTNILNVDRSKRVSVFPLGHEMFFPATWNH